MVLAEAAGSRTLSDLVRELVARSSLIAMLYHTSNDPQCSSDEHEELLQLCRSGNAEAAVEGMRAHLSRIEASLSWSHSRTAASAIWSTRCCSTGNSIARPSMTLSLSPCHSNVCGSASRHE